MSKFALALSVGLYTCLANPASACQSSSFILNDNLKTPDSGWDPPNTNLTYGPSGASIVTGPSRGYFSLNNNFTSDGTDICTTVNWPAQINEVKNKEFVAGGIIFWAKDTSNFYEAGVDALGNVDVSRLIAGKWSRISLKYNKDLNLARLSPSDKNEVEVQITGSHASIRLNGKPVLEINGQPPSGSGYVGIYASVSEPVFPILFSNFQIAAIP